MWRLLLVSSDLSPKWKRLMTEMPGVGSGSNGGPRGTGLLLDFPACIDVLSEVRVHTTGLQGHEETVWERSP